MSEKKELVMNLKHLSNQDLTSKLKLLVQEERRLNLELLHHLKEIEIRRLHLQLGYSSLFDYLTREFSYSEDAAYQRISAMRLLRDLPQVEKKIESGELSLTAACKIQKYLQIEKKSEKALALVQALELIDSLAGKSTRQVEKELADRNPIVEIHERARAVGPDQIELKMIISEETNIKLQRLKNLLSHKKPKMSYVELLGQMADLALEKWDKAKQRNVSGGAPQKPALGKALSRSLQRHVWQQAQGRCQYRHPQSKKTCGSQFQLQIDHIHPRFHGGSNGKDNLQLLCAQHNRFKGVDLI